MQITNYTEQAIQKARKTLARYHGCLDGTGAVAEPFALAHWLRIEVLEIDPNRRGIEFRLHRLKWYGAVIEYKHNVPNLSLGIAYCIGHHELGHVPLSEVEPKNIYSWGSVFSPLEVEMASVFAREIIGG